MSDETARAPAVDRAPSPSEERASKRQKVDEPAPAVDQAPANGTDTNGAANGADKADTTEEKKPQTERVDNRSKGLAPVKREYVESATSPRRLIKFLRLTRQ